MSERLGYSISFQRIARWRLMLGIRPHPHCTDWPTNQRIYYVVMRPGWIVLLILALVVGQANAFRTVYLCPDGTECKTCAEKPCEPVGHTCGSNSQNEKAECQQCCEATTVPNHQGHEKSLSASGPVFVAALLPTTTGFALPTWTKPAPVGPALVSLHWPHAPPGAHSSRAPPEISA